MDNLADKLLCYSNQDYYPFHMPGHKRNTDGSFFDKVFSIDITEIEGFDNLHHSQEILLSEQQFASKVFGSDKSYFLVNGSTVGILAAISALTERGGKILLARNCHKSAYNAIYINGLEVEYLYPSQTENGLIYGCVQPEDVKEALLNAKEQIQAVVITSPSFDGVVSDIKKIAEICHCCGVPLIVDGAHGAHFGFSRIFPKSAVECDADIVIQSLHKTLPSLTQTAILHINQGFYLKKGLKNHLERLERYLAIYQSSSPSYVLMASISYCIHKIAEERELLYKRYEENLVSFLEKMKALKHLQIMDEEWFQKNNVFDFDKSKIIVNTYRTNMSGQELFQKLLEQYHLTLEMASEYYVLAISSVMDTAEGFDRLAFALLEIDATIDFTEEKDLSIVVYKNEQCVNLTQAMDGEKEKVIFSKANDRISAEFIYLYPPGIPLITPGEKITIHLLSDITRYQKMGLSVQGPVDYQLDTIQVLK